MHRKNSLFILILLTAWLTSCKVSFAEPYQERSAPLEIIFFSASTMTPTPTQTPEPSPTPVPVHLTATLWQTLPKVPILMYHRFIPQGGEYATAYKIHLSDFDGHLSTLYDAGFSLISLSDWVQGSIHVPEGRRPLIITIDDLFYADQLSLDEQGQPASYSGVGRLWQFSQEHHDFNFHVGLFFNLGDKSYTNRYANGSFYVEGDWRKDRAEAIVWGVENGAIPMNHFYNHPFLNKLSPTEIQWELEENDRALREALTLAGKQAIAEALPNILALPYVVWPATQAGKQVLFDYVSPEGAPVTAILEADDAYHAKLFPSPYSTEYDPWHVPRINGTWDAIDAILQMSADIPTASQCDLGYVSPDSAIHSNDVMNAILARVHDGRCPQGLYIVGDLAFQADENGIIQLSP